MELTYRVIEQSEIPLKTRTGHKGVWKRLHELLQDLPEGKWIEITPPPGKSLKLCQCSIGMSLKRYFPVKVYTNRELGKLYVTRKIV